MHITERVLDIPCAEPGFVLPQHFARHVADALAPTEIPVRFVVTSSTSDDYTCEIGVLSGLEEAGVPRPGSIFDLRRRALGPQDDSFNVVLLVPTGIGAEIGGHAGDAGPVAIMMAEVADRLITHPNVVNGSDINELPSNGMYVEGSVICRLLNGTAGLRRPASNRVLCVIDDHDDRSRPNTAINAINAARATCGFDCAGILTLEDPVRLSAEYSASGRAVGTVTGLEKLTDALHAHEDTFDALALVSDIDVPANYHLDYYLSDGAMVNPWGGVEAVYTHAISLLFDVPVAHAPIPVNMEQLLASIEAGIVDPRQAAEAVSRAFLHCVLKGLQRSPRVITGEGMLLPGVMTADDISCLVIPDGCLGLPVLAALEQGIPVIAVRENANLMGNDLARLPWAPGQFRRAENYWEAAGILVAMRAGIAAESARRPFGRASTRSVAGAVDPVNPAKRDPVAVVVDGLAAQPHSNRFSSIGKQP